MSCGRQTPGSQRLLGAARERRWEARYHGGGIGHIREPASSSGEPGSRVCSLASSRLISATLQERLWKLSGSQCGFCTPGIVSALADLSRTGLTILFLQVMSIYALWAPSFSSDTELRLTFLSVMRLRNASAKGSLSVADIELEGALDGNLCRSALALPTPTSFADRTTRRCTGYKPILDAAKTFVGEYAAKLGSGGERAATLPVHAGSDDLPLQVKSLTM